MSAIPDWLPAEPWAGYIEMRKKIKRPMTDRAVQLAIGTLDKLREQGQDVGAVLDQSVLNSWQGIFPLRAEAGNDQPRRQIAALGKHGQATANNAQDWLEDFV